MRYVALGDTFSFKFTTRDFDTGAPQTLGGTPVISAYEDSSATEITAGITLTVDFDSRTGLNDVSVVATGANGYEEGKYYAFTITTGTVDAVSVVGEVVHEVVVGPVDANVEQWEGDAGSVKRGITSNLPQVDVDGWQGEPIAGSANMIEDVGGPRWTAPALSQAPGSVGGTLSGHWRWSTDTTATDPGSGRVKGNNATLGSITQVFVNQIADDGFNFAGAIEDLGLGDTITVARDSQGGNFFLGTVQSEPVDNGDWYTIPVVVTDSGGSLGNNNAVNVSFHYQQASAAEIADAVWDEALAAHTSAGSTGEALDDINANTGGLAGAAMRGTDNAALATDLAITDGKVDTINTNTAGLGGDAMRGTDNALLASAAPTNFGDLAITTPAGEVTVGTNTDKTGYSLAASITVKKGEALPQFHFLMKGATTKEPLPGLTVTGQIVKDTGSLVGLTNSITEIGNGLYRINGGLTASETNADAFTLQFTATGAETLSVAILTQAE